MRDLHWRVAEVIAWCGGRNVAADPQNSLRTPELRPPHLLETPITLRETVIRNASPAEWLASLPDPERATHVEQARHALDASLLHHTQIHAERQAILRTLAETRADRLRAEGRYPRQPAEDLAGGRLLLMECDFTVLDGVSALESEGFFDEEDIPPWDTWICCLTNTRTWDEQVDDYLRRFRRRGKTSPYWASYLVCWVPPELITLAHAGIEINPVGTVEWAPDDFAAWMRGLNTA